jgi:hypothetical protein
MFRLPISRSAALVTATAGTRGISQRGGQSPSIDQLDKAQSQGVMRNKDKPMKGDNQKLKKDKGFMDSKTSRKSKQ